MGTVPCDPAGLRQAGLRQRKKGKEDLPVRLPVGLVHSLAHPRREGGSAPPRLHTGRLGTSG